MQGPLSFPVGVGARGREGSMQACCWSWPGVLSQLVPVRERIPVRDESRMDYRSASFLKGECLFLSLTFLQEVVPGWPSPRGQEKTLAHLKETVPCRLGRDRRPPHCPGLATLPCATLSRLPCGLPAPGAARRPPLPWLEAGRCMMPAPMRAQAPPQLSQAGAKVL